jgi:peptidoglycan/xylan/chitin deacetylase (PgdA/CDA1 family)
LNINNRISRRDFSHGLSSAALSVAMGPAAKSWPKGARAAVSLTYDDGYDSQLENVEPVLDQFGLKATFFLTVENIDERLADWKILAKKGHEIADHTMSHPCELEHFSAQRFLREQIAPAENYFDAHFGGSRPRCFAYPCGMQLLGGGSTPARLARYEELLHRQFYAARTVYGEPNDPLAAQRYALSARVLTNSSDAMPLAIAYVEKAIERRHWAILVFHEVLNRPKGPWDTGTAAHYSILKRLSAMPIWCAPIRDVFGHISGAT